MVQLIFQLPALVSPPPAFTNGTPAHTTPIRPEPAEPILPPTIPEAHESTGFSDEDDEVTDGAGRRSPSARRGSRVRDAAGLVPEVGRIPGEYHVGAGEGNGG